MDNCRSTLVFYVNSKRVEDAHPEPTQTLLSYLRLKLRLTGAKLACGEGGCGACTVMMSRFVLASGNIEHRSICACITPVCAAHGSAITTVEGIGNSITGLHAVQERLALSHGSQCGFCTPGMVMSMYTLLRNSSPGALTDEILESAFQGNLCRCTGYRPILDGFKTFCGKGNNCCKMNSNAAGDIAVESPCLTESSLFAPYDVTQEPIFPSALQMSRILDNEFLSFTGENSRWIRPVNCDQLRSVLKQFPNSKLVAGNTNVCFATKYNTSKFLTFVYIDGIPELKKTVITDDSVEVGSTVSVSDFKMFVDTLSDDRKKRFKWAGAFSEMLSLFAGRQIRNAATIGGTIMAACPSSDLMPLLAASHASVKFISPDGIYRCQNIGQKLCTDLILLSVCLPTTQSTEWIAGFKQTRRYDGDVAIVNAGMNVEFETASNVVVKDITICYGGIARSSFVASQTCNALRGMEWDNSLLTKAMGMLSAEIVIPHSAPGGSASFRKTLVGSFFCRFFLQIAHLVGNSPMLNEFPFMRASEISSAIDKIARNRSSGSQLYQAVPLTEKRGAVIGVPVVHTSALKQVAGEAMYTDDIPRHSGELYMVPVLTTIAHGTIQSIDYTAALKSVGVAGFADYHDVPCNSYRTSDVEDERVFVNKNVEAIGQIITCVLADTEQHARIASRLVKVEYAELPPVITTEEAIIRNNFFDFQSKHECGDPDTAISESDIVVEGEFRVGGQEHFYLEPHSVIVIPRDGNELEIFVTSQHPHAVQMLVSHVLKIPANRINVRVKRIGGGFGGKESRCCLIAAPAAVCAIKFSTPVRCVLDRHEDMLMTGNREPTLAKYKIGADNSGKITAVDVKFYLNSGYSTDFTPAIGDAAVVRMMNGYAVENIRGQAFACKTNTVSNTACRGAGTPQAVLTAEIWMLHVSEKLNRDTVEIRELNFMKSNVEVGHHKGNIGTYAMEACWKECLKVSDYYTRRDAVDSCNLSSRWKKRGLYIQPLMYGASFMNRYVHQGFALVHIYMDGTILLTHGGVEMGQGLQTKMAQVASNVLGVSHEFIHTSEVATDKIANGTASSASFSTDLNGRAVMDACQILVDRMSPIKQKNIEMNWKELVNETYRNGVSLSATGYHFDDSVTYESRTNPLGQPFSHYSYGAACAEVEIDVLTGGHIVRRVDIVMDVGKSLNPAIDIGQIEGGFMQGYGLFVLEEHRYSPSGLQYTTGTGSYKIPGFNDIPEVLNVHLLRDSHNESVYSVYSSKVIGEPPVCLAGSVFLAIRDAVKAARKESGIVGPFRFDSPATAENIRISCADEIVTQNLVPATDATELWDVKI